jgi:oligopeptide/dipeptide ABC transporter ATP-binding protein
MIKSASTAPEPTGGMPFLEVHELVKHYDSRRGLWGKVTGNPGSLVQAVDGVSLSVKRGKTLGLIGESGCGKSTLGRAILRLHEPTSGTVKFDGVDVTELNPVDLKKMRRRMQIIFQDPYASLNPRKTIEDIIGTALRLQGLAKGSNIRGRVTQLLENVGLKPDHMTRFPHQFSGGQRQRIGIARALALNPEFIVCDEPVSALDVSIQAQIIQLLDDLKHELGLTYLFISHDISVIGYVSDHIAVMYLGDIVETGPTKQILENPQHPYTQALLSAVPRVDGSGASERVKLVGDLPSPISPPAGCKFHTRCPYAEDECQIKRPEHKEQPGEISVACHLVNGKQA